MLSLAWDVDGNGTFGTWMEMGRLGRGWKWDVWDVDGNGTFGALMEMGHSALLGTMEGS